MTRGHGQSMTWPSVVQTSMEAAAPANLRSSVFNAHAFWHPLLLRPESILRTRSDGASPAPLLLLRCSLISGCIRCGLPSHETATAGRVSHTGSSRAHADPAQAAEGDPAMLSASGTARDLSTLSVAAADRSRAGKPHATDEKQDQPTAIDSALKREGRVA